MACRPGRYYDFYRFIIIIILMTGTLGIRARDASLKTSCENSTISRYCYWDRPGYAWSDNAPSLHSAGVSADALSEALARAGEEGPWILVSASSVLVELSLGGVQERIASTVGMPTKVAI
ncbi:uncharacterized protein K441DRAFT_677934 [Cenococcum geophilum 1.58]|uniref:uncharacterized protein n=1 Tax=Cenococcum geophilum 1.58 TaxID=794803 RepID=UPI00358F078C|nr:hypothetical protein K441DRAFT_677934 [Cenococcum geophilum 1.58]